MIRATWILGSLTAVMLAACQGGANRDQGAAEGTGMESGSMGDTATMAPSAVPMDTALTDTTTPAPAPDTAVDTTAP